MHKPANNEDDTSRMEDELLDEFEEQETDEAVAESEELPEAVPATDPVNATPRLNILPEVDLSQIPRNNAARGLIASRSGDLSPVRVGEAHAMMALLWVYRFGWSTREVLDALRGSKGDGLTKSLIGRGLLHAYTPKNPTVIHAKAYMCLTAAGVAAIESWSLEWEVAAEDLYQLRPMPASYPAWVRASLLPPESRYHCLDGRIRHARAQHDLLLQRWFLHTLLNTEPHETWGIRIEPGALLPADWGSVVLGEWRFADEIESHRRRVSPKNLGHIPDLELRTKDFDGNGGLKTIEVELENARKRQDEIDAQVLRSVRMTRDGRHLDDAAAMRHTLILSNNEILAKKWIRAFGRDAVTRWIRNQWRKREAKGTIDLGLPVDWENRTSIAWDSQILRNIVHPASFVQLRTKPLSPPTPAASSRHDR